MAKITIAGKEVDVADEVAAHLASLEQRTAAADEATRKAAEEHGRAKAEAEAKARAEEDARRKAEQDALIKKGEFEKAIELERKNTTAVAERFRDAELRALVAGHPKLRKHGLDDAARAALIDDVVAQLRPSAAFDLAAGKVTITANGTPVDPQAHLDAFIAARPYLAEPEPGKGSGAGPSLGDTRPGAPGLTRAALTGAGKHLDWIKQHGPEAWAKLPSK